MLKRMKNKKGFTLIELIVVIAILAILAAIAIPRLAGFTEAAKEANDEELAAIVANAAAMYIASNSDKTPITTGTAGATEVLINTAAIGTAAGSAGLITYADDTTLLAALRSAKYKAGTQAVTYTLLTDGTGTIQVQIGGTVKATAKK